LALNYIWIFFFVFAFLLALSKLFFTGDTGVFTELVNSTFSYAKTGFEISLGLTGVLAFWLGLLKIAEESGLVQKISNLISPLFRRIFPEIPKGHPVTGNILMNFSANMLGLDNAATPIGLKAMGQLQELNPEKERASNAQIMFLVLNTSGLTIIPVNVMVYRAQMGAANPSDIFLPILIATFISTLVGLLVVSIYQRINLLDKLLLGALLGSTFLISILVYFLTTLDPERLQLFSSLGGNFILFSLITFFIAYGAYKRINAFEAFIDGAKEGFNVAIKIIPYLVAILVGIGVFRTAGGMELFSLAIGKIVGFMGMNTDFVDALPTAIMKPLSGSGSRGMMIDAMKTFGPDSFTGRLASTFQGSTDTTFYILAVYFGSVGIRNTRYAMTAGLLADLAGIIAAIFVAYLFFH
jgi:spore maturation protein SpmA